jgi:diadenosine tetraphosphate (Ap4A) HIT family hydrolase
MKQEKSSHFPFFDLFEPERRAINQLLDELRKEMMNKDVSVNGFNIGMNNGVTAGQTIAHAHVHLIPRRQGDVQDPRSGVRGVIRVRPFTEAHAPFLALLPLQHQISWLSSLGSTSSSGPF